MKLSTKAILAAIPMTIVGVPILFGFEQFITVLVGWLGFGLAFRFATNFGIE